MKDTVAIIDLGTNTFHVLIIEITLDNEFKVIDKFKESVKLAEGSESGNHIIKEAFQRGLDALLKIKQVIDSKNVSKTISFATSAIRSAQNGKEFIQKAYESTGIEIQVINGSEEAALIFNGVQFGVSLPVHKDVLVMDIGGGSVEFIVGNRQGPKFLRSLNLGAARILERVGTFDQISQAQINLLQTIFENELNPVINEISEFKLQTLVGSSGTFETLGILSANDANEKELADNLNGYHFDMKRFKKLYKKILNSTRAERQIMPGVEALRVDMIVLGAMLTNYVADKLAIESFKVSTYALKEGIMLNFLSEYKNDEEELSNKYLDKSPREMTVINFAKKFGISHEKAEYMARLALSIFDQTQIIHNFGPEERELLYFSTLLVDIGHYIQRSGHHKHGQYIIQNSSLPGFSGKELLLMANIVRYHRKSLPSIEHLHYNVLYKEDKNIVNKLGGILRIVVNLTRTNVGAIQSLTMNMPNSRELVLKVLPSSGYNVELETETAKEAKEMFEKAFEIQLQIIAC